MYQQYPPVACFALRRTIDCTSRSRSTACGQAKTAAVVGLCQFSFFAAFFFVRLMLRFFSQVNVTSDLLIVPVTAGCGEGDAS